MGSKARVIFEADVLIVGTGAVGYEQPLKLRGMGPNRGPWGE